MQSWRYTGQIATIQAARLEAVNTATREARAQESETFSRSARCQAAAQTRAVAARRDADAARSELDRLRGTLSIARGGVPGESAAACAQRADAAETYSASAQQRIRDLAAVADRHANDARTLIEAWPK